MAGNVVNLATAREERAASAKARDGAAKPAWAGDIHTACAYARLVRAEHDTESARIRFDQLKDGVTDAWWDGPEDIRERVHANNRQWSIYIGLLAHIATLPASTRSEASDKRNTVGKMWLTPGTLSRDGEDYAPGTLGAQFATMRSGCITDDHLFPPSMKLARR